MNTSGRAATLSDVARTSGLSLTTASRVLNGSDRAVGHENRERILAAAEALGYRPNLAAQTMARGRSRIVCLLVSDIADTYFAAIAAGVTRAAEASGLVVIIAQTARDTAKELDLVKEFSGLRPRAVVLATSRVLGDRHAKALAAELHAGNGLGTATVGRNDLGVGSVPVPNRAGARLLAEGLARRGYRRPAAIVGDPNQTASLDRLTGWQEGFSSAGIALADSHIEPSDHTREGGYRATQRLITSGRIHTIDVITAATDAMALGAFGALREAGIQPGHDIGVTGFNDEPGGRDSSPLLTTVHLPLEEIGSALLSAALAEEGSALDTPDLTACVIFRDSTPGAGSTLRR